MAALHRFTVYSKITYTIVLSINCLFFQYVSEVVIGAPYAVTESLMNHFKVNKRV